MPNRFYFSFVFLVAFAVPSAALADVVEACPTSLLTANQLHDAKYQMLGAWLLKEFKVKDSFGEEDWSSNPKGVLIFNRDGSVAIDIKTQPSDPSAEISRRFSLSGELSLSGTTSGNFVSTASSNPFFSGQDLVADFSQEGDELVMSLINEAGDLLYFAWSRR